MKKDIPWEDGAVDALGSPCIITNVTKDISQRLETPLNVAQKSYYELNRRWIYLGRPSPKHYCRTKLGALYFA